MHVPHDDGLPALLHPGRDSMVSATSMDDALDGVGGSPRRRSRTRSRQSRRWAMTAPWRDIVLGWRDQHAPLTSYERLVRASMAEVSQDERGTIRKDIRRSQPSFFSALAPGDFDLEAHSARLERILCAWTQYDAEIGYVQAMNLVCSTLLLLLDGDEEATFWALVVLLRQLPSQFYSRAPLQLLGFWTEVEVLSQLASRLLGLGDPLRNALLQVAPRWLLEFWVGTLPLELIVMIWDHVRAPLVRVNPLLAPPPPPTLRSHPPLSPAALTLRSLAPSPCSLALTASPSLHHSMVAPSPSPSLHHSITPWLLPRPRHHSMTPSLRGCSLALAITPSLHHSVVP